jgi:2-keto-3-deoxy-L-fuconate dehydrogenase
MALTAMSADDYAGLRVLVTGGAPGVGHAVAVTALRRGATVAVLDLDPAGAPTSAVALHADVTDDASVAESVEKAAPTMGGVDVLVNNAGIGAQGAIETNSLDESRNVFDVNVPGIVRVTRSALAICVGRPTRQSSTCAPSAATAGVPERAVYHASKRTVLSLTVAADQVGEGILVNCVNPGTVETPRISRLLDQAGPTPSPSAWPWRLANRPGAPGDFRRGRRSCAVPGRTAVGSTTAWRSLLTVGCRGDASATLPLPFGEATGGFQL